DVLEAERALVRDRRTLLSDHELALDERVEQRRHVEPGCELLQRALPEDAADHGCTLEEMLFLGEQRVDARGDERLDRVRDVVAAAAALGEHPHRLLEEERIALGLRQHELALLRRQSTLAQQFVGELLALLLAERRELDRGRAEIPAAPRRAQLEEL